MVGAFLTLAKPAARPSRGPKSILLVDDEADIVESLRSILRVYLQDAHVFTATSGREALGLLSKEHVDLILTDYKMPKMNGLEFLKEAEKIVPHVPHIILTAFEIVDRAGGHDIVNKPVDITKFIESVRRALSRRGAS